MSDSREHDVDSVDELDSEPPVRATTLCHVRIERYDGEPDLCTLYDALNGSSVRTTWISAEEGSYCSLEVMR